jgi:phosphatidylinositol alpha-mannosyltransferase
MTGRAPAQPPNGAGRPRIGVFLSSLPSGERKPGGADVLAHRVCNALSERGWDITVVSYSGAPGDALYRHQRIAPARLAHHRVGRILLVPWLWHRVRRRGRFDVVHLYGDDWFFLWRRVPTVRTFPGSALSEARTATTRKRRWSQLLVYGLELWTAKLATATYTLNAEERERYAARGTLTLGVEGTAAGSVVSHGRPIILFVGTWLGRKRGQLLAEVFTKEIRPHVPDAELWMVADRVDPNCGIVWHENPSDDKLAELFRQAQVFCLPSAYEGLGIPFIEAMAAGVPVVASDSPGARYVLDEGRAGRIVQDDALGATLVALLQNGTARKELAAKGLERARDFSWESVCAQYKAAYLHACVADGHSHTITTT